MDKSTAPSSGVKTKTPGMNRSAISSVFSRIWIPIRAKITMPFILIALVMAAVIAFILYQIVFENIDQRFNTQLVESGKLASEWMVQEENTRLAALRILAFTTGVGDALLARDPETLRLIAWGSTIGTQEDAVEFLDTQGKLVLSMRHRPGSIYVSDYIFATGSDVNYRQWTFVEEVLTEQMDAQGDKYSGLARASWGNYFYVSGPVFDSAGQFAGVILVGEYMGNLVSRMHLDIGSQVTIYDLEGKSIASTFTPPDLTSSLATSILEKQNNSSLRRDSNNQRNLTYKSIDYGEILGPWKLRNDQDLGLVGTAIPKNLLVQTSTLVRTQLAVFVGLAMFIVIIMGGTIANLITHPLLELVKASREVTRGNLSVEVKPQSNDEVAILTENFNRMIASIQQSQTDQTKAYDSTLAGWSKATSLRDNETETHMARVTDIALQLARRMGLEGEHLTHIYRGALLHDIGKIGIPDSILKKPGKLSINEWTLMRMHPKLAQEMLYTIEYLRPSLSIPYCHHEKWDGSGYPQGIKGDEIPLIARIFAVVDVWDAMTSDRVYRKALTEADAFQYILESRGTHFDPQVVDAFMELMKKT
jgi:HD-GYP domain-containing protein (c-di-GMP phosphodiesterase class II)